MWMPWRTRRANRLRIPAAVGSGMVLLVVAATFPALAQAAPPTEAQSQPKEAPYTVRVTTREVLVDLIARDQKNHPVTRWRSCLYRTRRVACSSTAARAPSMRKATF
jgi:hypothetical protein